MAKLLVDQLQVRVSETSITKELEEHPDYPSLLSISDVLKNYGVENLAVHLTLDKLSQLPVPFLVPLKNEKGKLIMFSVVKEVEGTALTYYDTQHNAWKTASIKEFGDFYGNIVLMASAEENAGEQEFEKVKKEEKLKWWNKQIITYLIPVLLLLVGLFSFINYGIQALLPFLFSIATLAGTGVCILLLWYEVDHHNPYLKQICTGGQKMNCEAILQSNASSIAGISWSVIGACYFMGILLILLLHGFINHQIQFFISWINILVLPYTVFSVFYQWRIAKQWCKLCLSVQALLVTQFIIALGGSWQFKYDISYFSFDAILGMISAFAIPFIALQLLITALKGSRENKTNRNDLQRLKHNQEIFDSLLFKQEKVAVPPDGLGIIKGNPNARYKLIKVCNPYCGYCSKVHAPMEELLETNKDLQIQIIFFMDDIPNHSGSETVKHLMAIHQKGDIELTSQALNDWYAPEIKDYTAFAKKYPIDIDFNAPNANLMAMAKWCEEMKVAGTPTFYINGYKLPEIYTVQDLKYFLSV